MAILNSSTNWGWETFSQKVISTSSIPCKPIFTSAKYLVEYAKYCPWRVGISTLEPSALGRISTPSSYNIYYVLGIFQIFFQWFDGFRCWYSWHFPTIQCSWYIRKNENVSDKSYSIPQICRSPQGISTLGVVLVGICIERKREAKKEVFKFLLSVICSWEIFYRGPSPISYIRLLTYYNCFLLPETQLSSHVHSH